MDTQTLKEALIGAKLALLDDEILECFHFSTMGDAVAATLGAGKDPACAPGLHYRVTDDGRVEITDGNSIHYVWEQVEHSDGVLTVRCGQWVKRFSYAQAKKRERYLP